MPSFFGEFEQTIDGKHRMSLPMALRDQITPETDGVAFVVMLGSDGHLWIYPNLVFKRLQEALQDGPLPDLESEHMLLLSALAREMSADKQGRVVLPEKSLQRAGLKENDSVTLVGARDHIQVWPTADWEAFMAKNLPQYGTRVNEAAKKLRRGAAPAAVVQTATN
jgi:MraZ protein